MMFVDIEPENSHHHHNSHALDPILSFLDPISILTAYITKICYKTTCFAQQHPSGAAKIAKKCHRMLKLCTCIYVFSLKSIPKLPDFTYRALAAILKSFRQSMTCKRLFGSNSQTTGHRPKCI